MTTTPTLPRSPPPTPLKPFLVLPHHHHAHPTDTTNTLPSSQVVYSLRASDEHEAVAWIEALEGRRTALVKQRAGACA